MRGQPIERIGADEVSLIDRYLTRMPVRMPFHCNADLEMPDRLQSTLAVTNNQSETPLCS